MKKWYVVYDVDGFGRREAGPWELGDAMLQRDDIQGFEGVKNVRLVHADDLEADRAQA